MLYSLASLLICISSLHVTPEKWLYSPANNILSCGVHPKCIGRVSRARRVCIQSATFLLERHSNFSVWNSITYYVSAPIEWSHDHSKERLSIPSVPFWLNVREVKYQYEKDSI